MGITGIYIYIFLTLGRKGGKGRGGGYVGSTEDFSARCIFRALGQYESNVDQGKGLGRTSRMSLSYSRVAWTTRSSFPGCIASFLPPRSKLCPLLQKYRHYEQVLMDYPWDLHTGAERKSLHALTNSPQTHVRMYTASCSLSNSLWLSRQAC